MAQVLFVGGFVGGYPGPEREQEYVLFGQLYAEGYRVIATADEDGLLLAKEDTEALTGMLGMTEQTTRRLLEEAGHTVVNLEDARPELLPEPNRAQLAYKR